MKLRFPENEITLWAEKYKLQSEEIDLIGQKDQIHNVGYLTKDQLRLVANWKAPRSAGHVEKNDTNYVREITALSFSAKEQRSRIELLTLLDGVLWPSASVILHLFHPEPYPLLDFRALWSVGVHVPSQYSFRFWWEYVEFCRELAYRNAVTMRVLDRALWQYSKEKQGLITNTNY